MRRRRISDGGSRSATSLHRRPSSEDVTDHPLVGGVIRVARFGDAYQVQRQNGTPAISPTSMVQPLGVERDANCATARPDHSNRAGTVDVTDLSSSRELENDHVCAQLPTPVFDPDFAPLAPAIDVEIDPDGAVVAPKRSASPVPVHPDGVLEAIATGPVGVAQDLDVEAASEILRIAHDLGVGQRGRTGDQRHREEGDRNPAHRPTSYRQPSPPSLATADRGRAAAVRKSWPPSAARCEDRCDLRTRGRRERVRGRRPCSLRHRFEAAEETVRSNERVSQGVLTHPEIPRTPNLQVTPLKSRGGESNP